MILYRPIHPFKCGRRYAILSLMTKLDSLPSLLLTMAIYCGTP